MSHEPHVAYFCQEFGLANELPLYAGGLGILAGDLLKAAKDAAKPLIGIGILWRRDYTSQYIGEDGRPFDRFPAYDFDFLPDAGVVIPLRIAGQPIECRVKVADMYNNAPLYLLDTCSKTGKPWSADRLYGGGPESRIAAEMVLGIGGVRLLRRLGIDVDIYHLNEGHAVLAGLELIREYMNQGLTFAEARTKVRQQVVFTTHTPVRAGNEEHQHNLLQRMGAYNGLDYSQLRMLGGDPFNMTLAGLRLAGKANAVSKIHCQTARRMWEEAEDSAPIVAITNGVHQGTWQDELVRRALPRGDSELWQAHKTLKARLLAFIAQQTGKHLDPDALLVGFARRAAPYKRGELIFRSPERIEPLLRSGRLQLVFSGKAHPDDQIGKRIVTDLARMAHNYEKVVFLENYDMRTCRSLISGCDVWLNNPRRPLEASGTSGMKAALNGVLNLSVMDGWIPEGVEHGVSGWIIDQAFRQSDDHLDEDSRDMQALYRLLYDEVIPTYYQQRDRWCRMMRSSIQMAEKRFTAARLLQDYYRHLYTPVQQPAHYSRA